MTAELIIIATGFSIYLAIAFWDIKKKSSEDIWPGEDDENNSRVTCGVCGKLKRNCEEPQCPFKTGDGGSVGGAQWLKGIDIEVKRMARV